MKEHVVTTFRCGVCDRVFDKQNALSVHMRVHEKQQQTKLEMAGMVKQLIPPLKRYMCSICNASFGVPKDLRNHVISAHPF